MKGSMIAIRKLEREVKKLILLGLFLVISGCTTSVQVKGTVPFPKVATIPARVGIHYSNEFRSFRHEETIKNLGTWEVELGEQNLLVINSLFTSLFEEVREIAEPPGSGVDMTGLEGILVPSITEYGFLVPGVSGLKFFSASIHYRISYYNRKGEKVGEWNTVGYGKSELSGKSQGESLGDATLDAIRDAGARIATKMIEQPSFINWTKSMQVSAREK